MTIEVTLHGANGTRQTTVENRGGFHTRHVKAPREAVPSIFGDVSIRKSQDSPLVSAETTPEVSPQRLSTPVTKEPTTEIPEADKERIWERVQEGIEMSKKLKSLLSECDYCLEGVKRHPVMTASLERGAAYVNERADSENAYCERNNVEAKREVAMALWNEIQAGGGNDA